MHTIISIYKNNKDLDLTTCELEILHRIAFDYTIEEMDVETTAGLIRVAF